MDKIVIAHDPESEGKRDEPAAVRRRFPCSQAQQRFWFEELLHPGNPGLNVAVRWKLEGAVSTADLETAWRVILERQQALRTSFDTDDGEPVQVVEPHVAFSIPMIDLTLLPPADAEREADRIAEIEARTPFDLSAAPLIRVTRIVLRENVSILLVTAHHAVCDGWSIGVLAREMGEICRALQSGEAPDLPELPMSYGEHAEAERAWLKNASLETESDFSKRLLAGYKQFELLPDHPRPAIQTSNGAIASRLLPKELTSGLALLARSNGCTLFMAAYAAFLTLLQRYSGESDIALGTQVVGRDEVELENLAGCFINTVALRTDMSGDPTFTELLERARDTVTETFEVRHFPLERFIEVVNPKRDLSRNALFSVNLIFQRSFIENADYGTFKLVDLPSRSAGALYDLNFFMVERPEGWRASCEYNSDLFDDETIAGMLGRFETLLGSIVADPNRRISELPLLSEADRHELVVLRNQTAASYPADSTVADLFEAQAAKTPDATAIACGERTLTYRELSIASDNVAAELQKRGYAPGARIGVLLHRSVDLIVALMGVLKSGSAYVPLDPAYPAERLRHIAGSAELAALITGAELDERLSDRTIPIVRIEDIPQRTGGASPIAAPRSTDPAYVIYTSGSTGKPKGVAVGHRALVNFLCAMEKCPGLSSRDTLVAVTTVSFDIAGLEMYLPLVTGAKLVIAREDEVVDGAELLDLLRRSGATAMQATPITWQLLLEGGWRGEPALKMLCGGEALSRELAARLLERGGELWNMYGPTETTIWSSVLRLEDAGGSVPLGPPIANTQFYVLDASQRLAPPGAAGELFIGGDGVALGYFGAPDLTAERFVADTFSAREGSRLYRTGDIVRWRANGTLEFLGRSDNQVKIRGFRIELGEVESILLREPAVSEAVVDVSEDFDGGKSLVAYVVPREGSGTFSTDALRAALGRALPGYMVPSAIVELAALPRTPNGKIDRNALQRPQERRVAPVAVDTALTPNERALSDIVVALLGRDTISVDQDIFSLGFHSLLAVRLISRVKQNLHVALPVRTIFAHPTIRELARELEAPAAAAPAAPAPQIVDRYNESGSRTPFIYFHNDILHDGSYAVRLADAVGADQPFYAIAPHGSSALETLPASVEEMARDHLVRVKAMQPHGPYRLGGICVSGLVAFEVGRLLRQEGETVEDIVLINSGPLPTRSIPVFDWLVRRIGVNWGINATARELLINNIARIHTALVHGPQATIELASERVKTVLALAAGEQPAHSAYPRAFIDPEAIPKTKNYFRYVVCGLTYHPKAYDANVTLIWGTDQPVRRADETVGWGELAKSVRITNISGAHTDVDFGEVATKLVQILGDKS